MSPNSLYKLIGVAAFPYRRVGAKGGKIVIDPADLDAYWASCRVTEPRAAAEPEVRSAGKILRPPPTPFRRRP